MFQATTDAFGNIHITANGSVTDVDSLHKQIENVKKPKKAIIFVGFAKEVVRELNSKYRNEIVPLTERNNVPYYLLPNDSNSPQFCDGNVRASGVSVIVEHQNGSFAILVKDKTKKVLTCIGGTCTQHDYQNNSSYSTDTAIRELNEETMGFVPELGPSGKVFCNGLLFRKSDLNRLAEVELESTYYGLIVPDFYTCFGAKISTVDQPRNDFLNCLFDSRNITPEGNYKLNYINHDETEYIYAIRLQDGIKNMVDSESHFVEAMGKIVDQTSKITLHDCRISGIHMFLNYLNHCGVDKQFSFKDKELFKQAKLPPFLRKLSLE